MGYLVGLAICGSIAFVCYAVAKDRGKDPAAWAVLGFIFPCIAVPVLLLTPRNINIEADMSVVCPSCASFQIEEDGVQCECFSCGKRWTEEPLVVDF